MEHIQNDCYWFVEEATQTILAMCVGCGNKYGKEWYWNGSKVGYGDYDLNCSACGTIIYRRSNFETDTNSESSGE